MAHDIGEHVMHKKEKGKFFGLTETAWLRMSFYLAGEFLFMVFASMGWDLKVSSLLWVRCGSYEECQTQSGCILWRLRPQQDESKACVCVCVYASVSGSV